MLLLSISERHLTVVRDILRKKLSAIGIRGLVLAALIALHSNAAAQIIASIDLSQSFSLDMGLNKFCIFSRKDLRQGCVFGAFIIYFIHH